MSRRIRKELGLDLVHRWAAIQLREERSRAQKPASAPIPTPSPEPAPEAATEKAKGLESCSKLAELNEIMQACRDCELCNSRKTVVCGKGHEKPGGILFVGEGPGEQEDKQGQPFVGPSGMLLDKILAAVDLSPDKDFYITNVVKCRPPGNRAPKPEEGQACMPYLKRQIELLQPKLIVALGKVAATHLLDSDASMKDLRGKVHETAHGKVVVTYHPSYLLRRPTEKMKAWEDALFIVKTLSS